jgi:hypothetical protein
LEKLKICKVPMLYYKDHIPDLEQSNIHGEDDVVDAATLNVRNDYATKMLLLFYPFHKKTTIFLCLKIGGSSSVKLMKEDLCIGILQG